MKREAREFIKMIMLLSYPVSDKSELATRLLYPAFMGVSKKSSSKFDFSTLNSIFEMNHRVKEAYDSIAYSYLGKKDIKELCNFCISKFRTGPYINIELYRLVKKLLDLKISDLLLHVNAPDETFLLESSKSIKSGPLKLSTLVIPDNLNASELIKMRLDINETIYTNVDDVDKLAKFKPNKVFINPIYGIFDKGYKYSIKKNTFWEDLLAISEMMTSDSKVVALVPNFMLSNSIDKDKKEKIITNGYLEGIISLPLRYYSSSLKVEVSLLVLSKGNKITKVIDINDVFTISDIKSADLENITDYIVERYKEDFSKVTAADLIDKNSNLSITNIITSETYIGMKSLTQLSTIADVSKGTKKTKVEFKDLIDQRGESPYCLLNSNDIDDGVINYDKLTKLIYDSKLEKFIIKNGDVVITNKSSTPKLSVVDREDLRIIPTGSMIVISPHKNKLNGVYLKMFFESNEGINLLSKVQRGQKTTTLYPEDIMKLFVPCIDYKKQITLVRQYEAKLSELIKKKVELITIKEDIKKIINGDLNYDNE